MTDKFDEADKGLARCVIGGLAWLAATAQICVSATFSDANWVSMGGIPGTDDTVNAAVVDGSGNLYIGGSFTVAGDVIANHIAKWDGTSWSALGSGLNGTVLALAVSGNDVYAAGEFATAGGAAASNIAKWNGSSWSALGSGLGGAPFGDTSVYALAVSGSELYAGGYFTTAGGSAAANIAKWNGSSWTALSSGMNEAVHALALSGSELYAGGYFTTAGGGAASAIAKWNGSTWTALGPGMGSAPPGFLPYVAALAVSGSELYAGGRFTMAGGNSAANIAKWNGSSWSALGSGITNYAVGALAVSGSELYAGGYFMTAGGSAARNIAKWNGSSWSALGSGLGRSLYGGPAYALAVSAGSLYAGGAFETAGGSAVNNIAKWDGGSWTALGSGIGGVEYPSVSALAVSGSEIYAAGSFTTVGGTAANNIAKWNGNSWTALGLGLGGTNIPFGVYVYALAVSGSDLYAGGRFTTAGGSAATNIAKWDGSSWSALGPGADSGVLTLAVSGSDLYAGGDFTTAGGSAANHIAKWNGSGWSALGSGVDGGVFALAVSGANLYAGGTFKTAGGTAANSIAKWDGSSWMALGSGLGGLDFPAVHALAVSASDLYAGGYFESAGGNAAWSIAKWNGSNWTALGLGMDSKPLTLAVSGSDVYAGGRFTTAGGSTANYIAKWDGSSWSALGSGTGGLYPDVNALAVSGTDLYAGGLFTTAGGKVSAYIARAYLMPLPTLSMLGSGTDVTVSWPSVDTAGFALEQAGTLAAPSSWVTNTARVTDDGTNKSLTLPATNSPQFFRLRRP